MRGSLGEPASLRLSQVQPNGPARTTSSSQSRNLDQLDQGAVPAHMAFVRVIDVRVDSSLEDVLESFRFGMLSICQAGEVDVLEGRAV
jgi:hypothetical protein